MQTARLTGGGGGYQVIKAEQEMKQVQPLQAPNYFSLPAASNPGGGYPQQAIRAHCPEQAPAPALPTRPYPELLDDGGYLDYSNMWKF